MIDLHPIRVNHAAATYVKKDPQLAAAARAAYEPVERSDNPHNIDKSRPALSQRKCHIISIRAIHAYISRSVHAAMG